MRSYLSKVLYILAEDKRKLLPVIVGSVLSSMLEAFGIGLIGPFVWIASNPNVVQSNSILSQIYEALNLQSNEQFVLILGVSLTLIFCIKSLLFLKIRSSIYEYSFQQQKRLISKLLDVYLSVPYTFHLSRDSASLINNILLETQSFCHKCILPLLEAAANSITIFILLFLLAKTSILLLAMINAVILPTFLFFYFYKDKAKAWGRESSESYHEILRTINHSLGGVKETYVIGCKNYFVEQINFEATRNTSSSVKAYNFQLLPKITLETLLIVLLVAVISVYQFLFEEGFQRLISILSVFAVASIRMLPSANQLISSISQLQIGSHALNMLYVDLKNIRVYLSPSKIEAEKLPTSGSRMMSFDHQVELKNITYRYPNTSNPAVNNISLKVCKGDSIALIGRSGAGKTTLVDIILGLLQPESGDIYVDGKSVRADLRSWQNIVGYIPQSIFLIDDSIEKNIAFGVPDDLIDYEKLDKVIEMAQLQELVEHIPGGIKALVGERGVRLSGGQKQRIGIARALYHDREILILDEATSALDNETEKLITESIQSLLGSKTFIIIAHRLTTVKHCSHVYELKNGSILRFGSYKEVVEATVSENSKVS